MNYSAQWGVPYSFAGFRIKSKEFSGIRTEDQARVCREHATHLTSNIFASTGKRQIPTQVPGCDIYSANGDGYRHVGRSLIRASTVILADMKLGNLVMEINRGRVNRWHE